MTMIKKSPQRKTVAKTEAATVKAVREARRAELQQRMKAMKATPARVRSGGR